MASPLFAVWQAQALSLAQRPWSAALLTAPPGLGLDQFAVSLAAGLLCRSPTGAERRLACGACQSCRWVDEGQHPDLRWVRPAALEAAEEGEGDEEQEGEAREKKPSREIRIDQIRDLAGFSQLSSHRGGVRIAVIGPVESLNFASANALLKGLEEPAQGMRYLLYGERLQGVPATILSRCRRLSLSAPQAMLTAARLTQPDAPGEWLTALLAEGRFDPLAWAERAGKAPVRPVLEWMSLWILDLQRMQAGLAPLTFTEQNKGLTRQLRWLQTRPQSAQSLAEAQSRLQSLLGHADHPLNPRLRYENLFVSVQEVFPS